jgi:cell division protein FtsQ
MQQTAPAAGRKGSGGSGSDRYGSDRSGPARARTGPPREAADIDDEDFPRVGRASRFDDAPPRPWWRPASTVGRVSLALAAFTVLGGLATCGVLLRNFLDRDARFRIAGSGNIRATGLTEVSRAQMLPVFGEDIGRNIFFVPLAERRKQLEQIPWVESASVMRFLPDQIRVSIVEREPIAFVRQGQQIGLVDASGVLLQMPAAMMAQHHYSFPVVTGIDARDPLIGRRARMAVYQRLLAELDSNGQRLSGQISEIDLTDPEDARVLMPEPGGDVLAHFGEDHFLERYQRYTAHIAEWRSQYPKLAAVDLRYDQQVVLQMAPGAGGAQTATTGAHAAMAADGLSAAKPPAGQLAAAGSSANEAAAPAATAPKATGRVELAKAEARPAVKAHVQKLTAAERAKKKHAEQRRAALNASRQKTHTASGQGIDMGRQP